MLLNNKSGEYTLNTPYAGCEVLGLYLKKQNIYCYSSLFNY